MIKDHQTQNKIQNSKRKQDGKMKKQRIMILQYLIAVTLTKILGINIMNFNANLVKEDIMNCHYLIT